MNVLVAFEFSGIVRRAFERVTRAGDMVGSVDVLPSEEPGGIHWQADARAYLRKRWDLVIAHPPCTDLAVSGARWFAMKGPERMARALDLFYDALRANAPMVCVENPVSVASSVFGPPTQIVQPWMFGHGETKATCLWLKNLPRLRPTRVVAGRAHRVHAMPPGPSRWKDRSRTYAGIAEAMARQWSPLFGREWPE